MVQKQRKNFTKRKLRWPFIFSSKFFQAKDGVIENNHHLEEEKKFLKNVGFENVNKAKNSSNFQKTVRIIKRGFDLRGFPEIFL